VRDRSRTPIPTVVTVAFQVRPSAISTEASHLQHERTTIVLVLPELIETHFSRGSSSNHRSSCLLHQSLLQSI